MEEKIQTEVWLGNLKDRDRLEDLGLVERIILKFIFKQEDGRGALD
jgi:hypothetical protein